MHSIGIRGAGVAGLYLAQSLLKKNRNLKVELFDTRPAQPNPKRTFCYFNHKLAKNPVAPSKEWKIIKFSDENFERSIVCEDSPYTMIKGDTFFNETTAELTLLGATFHWNCSDVKIKKNSLIVSEKIHEYDLVVDSAFCLNNANSLLWQSFGGITITTKEPSFNSDEALLMDVGLSTYESPVSFIYLLAFSPYSALVEHTTFSRKPLAYEFHKKECLSWMKKKGIEEWQEIDCEHGAIPMGLQKLQPTPPWPTIGTSGYAIRAGTGFGFQNILSQVEELTNNILDYNFLKGFELICKNPNPLWQRWGDELFLNALLRVPTLGSKLLVEPLSRANDRDIISFLGGRATFIEALRFMNCVPKKNMLKALLS